MDIGTGAKGSSSTAGTTGNAALEQIKTTIFMLSQRPDPGHVYEHHNQLFPQYCCTAVVFTPHSWASTCCSDKVYPIKDKIT